MRTRRYICASVPLALLGGLSQSLAADLPVRALAPVPAFVDWTGVYVGGHVGYGGGMKDWVSNSDFAASGFLLGGQAGINKQLGSLVFGVELDGSWANIKGSQLMSIGGPVVGFQQDATYSSKIDSIVTIAGRAGLAADRWFVFAKGGMAAVHEHHSLSITAQTFPATTIDTLNESGSETRIVPMLGFGAEYALAGNWSLKGEYDYLHLGATNVTLNGNTVTGGIAAPQTDTFRIDQAMHILKFGANYRIGGIGADPHFAPVAAARGTNWSGAYLGVQAGYGFEHETWPDYTGITADSGYLRADNWLAGFNGGVNAQAGSFVFGVEGEWMWTGIKPSQTFSVPFLGPGTNQTGTLDTRIDWLAIASGKAGFVVGDRLLVYGKGGLAIAQEKHTLGVAIDAGGLGTLNQTIPTKAVHTGAVIGAGAEYALGNNWSAKAEYDYIKMFGQSSSGFGPSTVNTPGLVGTFNNVVAFSKMEQNLQLVKFGVNYHFAAQSGVVTARY